MAGKLTDLSQLQTLLSDEERRKLKDAEADEKLRTPGRGQEARVFTDTKRRRGKTVTVIDGIRWPKERLEELAKELKQFCASGGTVTTYEIEIQGDHRQKITSKLMEKGFTVVQ